MKLILEFFWLQFFPVFFKASSDFQLCEVSQYEFNKFCSESNKISVKLKNIRVHNKFNDSSENSKLKISNYKHGKWEIMKVVTVSIFTEKIQIFCYSNWKGRLFVWCLDKQRFTRQFVMPIESSATRKRDF